MKKAAQHPKDLQTTFPLLRGEPTDLTSIRDAPGEHKVRNSLEKTIVAMNLTPRQFQVFPSLKLSEDTKTIRSTISFRHKKHVYHHIILRDGYVAKCRAILYHPILHRLYVFATEFYQLIAMLEEPLGISKATYRITKSRSDALLLVDEITGPATLVTHPTLPGKFLLYSTEKSIH